MQDHLSDALDRLVSAHPESILTLLRAEDPMLAAEAARIVARLRISDAEPALTELSQRPESVVRLAALEAHASLESAAGVKALFAAMGDPDREIRTAATDAIERIRPPGAADQLQQSLQAGAVRGYDDVEWMNFLKTCVAVCGDRIVADLSQILNGRRWWGGRRPPTFRASAARALGLVGTDEARLELQKSEGDKSASVNSAVRAALRDLESRDGGVR